MHKIETHDLELNCYNLWLKWNCVNEINLGMENYMKENQIQHLKSWMTRQHMWSHTNEAILHYNNQINIHKRIMKAWKPKLWIKDKNPFLPNYKSKTNPDFYLNPNDYPMTTQWLPPHEERTLSFIHESLEKKISIS